MGAGVSKECQAVLALVGGNERVKEDIHRMGCNHHTIAKHNFIISQLLTLTLTLLIYTIYRVYCFFLLVVSNRLVQTSWVIKETCLDAQMILLRA